LKVFSSTSEKFTRRRVMAFSKRDKELGMDRNITRRDFLNGVAVTALTLGQHLNFRALAQGAKNYPPSATGLQGQTDASQTVMHAVRDGSRFDFGSAMPTAETYDLVVVGAGISGLAAAFLYRQQMPGARVLILDPLEDFGGHAKRNEFVVNGKTIIGYGGSQTLQTPTYFSAAVNKLLTDIAIDLPKFETYFDQAWSDDRGLVGGLFFPKEVWGEDVLVRRDGDISEWIQKTPMKEKAKQDLIAFVSNPPDDQARAGRYELAETPFEDLERSMRDLLTRALSGGDFDPAEDIAAITINRWSHGYAYEYMRPWDAFWPDGPLPIETARQPWGRIAIANSDSGAYAYAHSAIDQAVRAVRDLLAAPDDAPAFADFPGPPRDKLGL
jgi:hypothetical protein